MVQACGEPATVPYERKEAGMCKEEMELIAHLTGLVLPICLVVDLCSSITIEEAVQPFVALWHAAVCHN